jgi:small-conductance mechanosensitive channel
MVVNMISSNDALIFLKTNVFVVSNFVQLMGVVFSFITTFILNFLLKNFLEPRLSNGLGQVKKAAGILLFPLLWAFIQWTIVATSQEFHWYLGFSSFAAKFITAWVLVRGLSLFIYDLGLKRVVSVFVYTFTGLSILGLLSPMAAILEGVALNIGDLHISLFSILKGALVFYLLLRGTILFSRWVEKKFKGSKKIEPSLKELFIKLIRTFLIVSSVFLTLGSLGIDLSVFAVFGGTIGVGLGFGLQKVVSNLICGIILLLDRSIKPGDVVAFDGGKSYGEINRLGARCVSVRTRSGKEHLIPNEEFIIHKSENWSLSDSLVRLALPMRAALDSDVPLVMKLLIDATKGVNRVMITPAPGARLRAFSESAIEFELRVWINDPHNGVSKVKSDIYLNIWKLFKSNGIVIPHPQRDLHIPEMFSNQSLKEQKSFLKPSELKQTSS